MRVYLLAVLLLAGCTAGSGTLSGDASLDGSTWIELDLADGQVSSVVAPGAQALAQPRWRTSHILFHRIDPGSVVVTSTALPEGGEDEDDETVTSAMAYVAVFELTEAQWHRLAGLPVTASDLPATGMSAEDLQIAITARSTTRFRLDIPDDALWSVACAGGRNTIFTWGNGTAEEAVDTYAVHQPMSGSGGPTGSAPVGGRTANAFGLFDMHGNAWELVRLGTAFAARGGAWDSPVLQCRTMNRVHVDGDLAHPTVGARLVLRP
jgi:hypothetical protein